MWTYGRVANIGSYGGISFTEGYLDGIPVRSSKLSFLPSAWFDRKRMPPHVLSQIDSVCGHVIFVEAIFPLHFSRHFSPKPFVVLVKGLCQFVKYPF